MIGGVAALSFIPFLGRLHLFDWDEINFAESAREMLTSGDYRDVQIGFQPFAEKPPLFMWVQALSMRIFGVGEFAARLPNALVGIITLVGIYVLGRKLVDRRFGLWWALAFGGSLLPNLYFRSGIIDPLFNLLSFFGVAALAAFEHRRLRDAGPRRVWAGPYSAREWLFLLASGASIGLAVLTKGPVGLLLPGLTWLVFCVVKRKSVAMPIIPMVVWVIVVAIVAAPWYILVARQGSSASAGNFVSAFVARQLELLRTGVAGHAGPWYFHLVVLALGCFPASVFAISALRRSVDRSSELKDFRLWMILLLIVVVVVFSLVQTKIVHYSSLAYFPITFLAAQGITDVKGTRWPRYWAFAVSGIGFIWAALFLAVPIVGLMIANGRLDPSRLANEPLVRAVLAARVGWSPADLIVGPAYLATILVALVAFARKDVTRFAALLFVGTAIAVPMALGKVAPKIERYTQATPIAFYESLRGCDCYVAPLGFKSYAHLFYARVQPDHSAGAAQVAPDQLEEWLLTCPIYRPAYFMAKIDKADRWRGRPGLQTVGERNGFVFFRRGSQ